MNVSLAVPYREHDLDHNFYDQLLIKSFLVELRRYAIHYKTVPQRLLPSTTSKVVIDEMISLPNYSEKFYS